MKIKTKKIIRLKNPITEHSSKEDMFKIGVLQGMAETYNKYKKYKFRPILLIQDEIDALESSSKLSRVVNLRVATSKNTFSKIETKSKKDIFEIGKEYGSLKALKKLDYFTDTDIDKLESTALELINLYNKNDKLVDFHVLEII